MHDRAGWQRGNLFLQFVARDLRLHQDWLAVLVHPMHRKHVLGEIDPDVHNSHDFLLRVY